MAQWAWQNKLSVCTSIACVMWFCFTGEVTNSLTSVVHGIIGGVPIKFPLGNPNACVSCNITCPVQKDKQYTYAPVIHVLDSYPGVRTSFFLAVWRHSDLETSFRRNFCLPVRGWPQEAVHLMLFVKLSVEMSAPWRLYSWENLYSQYGRESSVKLVCWRGRVEERNWAWASGA